MAARIQRQRTRGYRMPPDAVYVGRGTHWGNPARIVANLPHFWVADPTDAVIFLGGTRQEARRFATTWFRDWINDPAQIQLATAVRRTLPGRDLACWCKTTDPCHADVLLEIANASR